MEVENAFDFTTRNAEIMKIVIATRFLHQKFFETDLLADVSNLDLDQSNAIAGVLSTLYNHMRKMKNTAAANRGQTYGANTATIGTKTHTISVLKEELLRCPDFNEFDYMVATPLVDLLTAFKMSYDEVRLSCSKFKVRVGNQVMEKKITNYGLSNVHIPLLTGLTYKPERRGGLMKTLGPLTLSIMLANETRYFDKMTNALKESIKMLPMCDQITECLRDMRSANEGGNLFKSLGDVLSIIGSRSASKAFFPLYMVVKYLARFPHEINEINFSGNKCLLFYNKCASGFRWTKKHGGNTAEIAQVVFHSIFVTSVEDLGVLGQITDKEDWNTRRQLNAVFEKSSQRDSQSFTAIKYKLFSRLASANMMRNTGTLQPMLFSIMRYSGSRKRTHLEAFKTYLETGAKAAAYGRDSMSLTYALTQLKDNYTQSLRRGEFENAGTVKWMQFQDGELVETDRIVQETGVYFYS